jgi:uncharacterized protein (DUF362 family)
MTIRSFEAIVKSIEVYDTDKIESLLPDSLFSIIKPGYDIVIKPNWVRQSHQFKEKDWEYVITHPAVITAVIRKVVEKLENKGSILVLDGPETSSNFTAILSRYPASDWKSLCETRGITFQIIDLRDYEWIVENNVITKRNKLPGDPIGNTEINLEQNSEFLGHKKSKKGYYGADYNIKETNNAHNGINNIYRVSKSVLGADVFINLPKLKTHKKSGITCCLKNLVGVNTYKNYLPHYSIGTPVEGGDQFPQKSGKNTLESKLLSFIKQYLLINPYIARIINPLLKLGKSFFGDTNNIIRSGNWYGNDTLWRMILDLNKIVFYSRPDGTLKEEILTNRKKYIGIVDAILCGEKNGPKCPEPKQLGYLICGINPVAIDATAASLIGFSPLKIPVIQKAFNIKKFKIVDFEYKDIIVQIDGRSYSLRSLPGEFKKEFEPHFGWTNILESK